ncbi:CBS domain-containing protein [Spinactinospora alkalitolerans]|uniref:CBS domain-containing protein n=1 Tax=Spinactinospora alkalitolerans TaxID=687207 RepID=A0A852TT90_9ACTN|nr:CBS domain-containing protein [Spinactinospora alkalitolerans]NYE47229.1 CBS domain-containing protein [Spinactinospora alkalitolerans]
MATHVSDVMHVGLATLEPQGTVADAARMMREYNTGDVLVARDERLVGIVTDRDIVVRTVASGEDPAATPVERICSTSVAAIGPDARVDDAIRLMREHAVRRLPVSEDGRLVGVVSIGDLAAEREPDSALSDISEAPPNA